MSKISVVLPSYLGDYEGCADSRAFKLKRAIESFVNQDYDNKELMIVSDGCEETIRITQTFQQWFPSIINLLYIEKQPLFSGSVRALGCASSSGKYICYLDSDDEFSANHLTSIVKGFEKTNADVVYWNDFVRDSQKHTHERAVRIEKGYVGTSCIAHKRKYGNWNGCDGRGHDYEFVHRLVEDKLHFAKIKAFYIVNHISGSVNF